MTVEIKPFASPAEIEEAYKKRKEQLLEKADDERAKKRLAEVEEGTSQAIQPIRYSSMKTNEPSTSATARRV